MRMLWASDPAGEIDLLARSLQWSPGQSVADVGAGNGRFAVAAAQLLGSASTVYATEIDAGKLEDLKALVRDHPALHPVASSESNTGLPESCCDSIFLRGVYHHLTQPEKIDRDLFRALKPGGRIAVIDFPPRSC